MTERARAGEPQAAPAVPLHLFLSRTIDARGDLTNVEIARRLGYAKPNVIAMMRKGTMKVPVSKVPALAEILNLDPIGLLQRVLMEYEPELWAILQNVLGRSLVTANELALIEMLRRDSRGLDPALVDNELFATGFRSLVGQALDEQVMRELADRSSLTAIRVSAASSVNEELEALCRSQAVERIALRRRLLTESPKV